MAQRSDDAANQDGDQNRHDCRDQQADQREARQVVPELLLDVVHIDAGTDDPAPGFEQLHVGDLRNRVLFTGLGPHVVNQSGAVTPGNGDHLVEQLLAFRVLDLRQILTVELRLHRMHDHLRAEIVDPEVVLTVVAEQANLLDGGLLSVGRGHGSAGFELVVVLEHTGGCFHDIAGRFLLAAVQVGADLLNHQHAENEQHDHGDHGDQPEALADGDIAQQIHE